jgi:hypothetical protein
MKKVVKFRGALVLECGGLRPFIETMTGPVSVSSNLISFFYLRFI